MTMNICPGSAWTRVVSPVASSNSRRWRSSSVDTSGIRAERPIAGDDPKPIAVLQVKGLVELQQRAARWVAFPLELKDIPSLTLEAGRGDQLRDGHLGLLEVQLSTVDEDVELLDVHSYSFEIACLPRRALVGCCWEVICKVDVGNTTATDSSTSTSLRTMSHSEEPRPDDSFGSYIQRIRRARGWTQRKVATDLGIDFTYLSKLENGRGEPPGDDTIRKLAHVLGLDPETLLALAGKVPGELRQMAQEDRDFAIFLRRLPQMSPEERRRLYRPPRARQR